MTELIRFNLKRLQRRHFIFVILSTAAILIGLIFMITTQQIDQANKETILKLDKQSEFLAQELQTVPVKPAKINQDQEVYWFLVSAKNQLLVALVQAKNAKQTKNEPAFRHAHRKMLLAAQIMNQISPNIADKYLQLSQETINQDLKRDTFLERSDQTIMVGRYSLATSGFLTLLLTILVNPLTLCLLMMLFNWTWREDFDSGTGRFLLLSTQKRGQLLAVNLLVNLILLLCLFFIIGILGIIICHLYASSEHITWQYPLAQQLSLVHQVVQLVGAAVPTVLLITLINNWLTILIKQLNLRLAVNVIVVLSMTLLPIFRLNFNPFWQLFKQFYAPTIIPISTFIGAGIAIIVLILILKLTLSNYSIKNH